MKDMFVCMGNASTTDTEAWVAQAKLAMDTTTTTSSDGLRSSSIVNAGEIQQDQTSPSKRAHSEVSFSDSRHEDSGVWSRTRGSNYDGSTYDASNTAIDATMNGSTVSMEGSFETKSSSKKPTKSRASDENVCVLAEGAQNTWTMSVAYTTPDYIEEEDEHLTERSITASSVGLMDDAQQDVVFENIDEAGAVIVGTVLKHAMSVVTGKDIARFEHDPSIENILKETKHHDFTLNNLDGMEFTLGKSKSASSKTKLELEGGNNKENNNIPEITLGAKSRDSDDDSVLNSDDDYDERDAFFRKKKIKEYSLKSKKGVDDFKQFLEGTTGQKNWHFWMDIDRAKLITDPQELKK